MKENNALLGSTDFSSSTLEFFTLSFWWLVVCMF